MVGDVTQTYIPDRVQNPDGDKKPSAATFIDILKETI
jgi:hypothetical protein